MAGNKTPQPLAWDNSPTDTWRAAVNAWPWTSKGGGEWLKTGNCPRCGHHMEVPTFGFTISEFTAGVPPKAPEPVPARCDCSSDHPERPTPLKTGCGQTGDIDPPGKA